jgi:transcriptional regulator of acetoin/glycerol metabolism
MHGFSAEAMTALQYYSWPGNIRELRNAVEVALVTCTERYGRISHLPASIVREVRARVAPRSSDRETLLEALRVVNWNKSAAAHSLKWSRMTVYRKMAQYGIGGENKLRPARSPVPGSSNHKR